MPGENRILTTNGTVISNVPDPGVTKRWSDPSTWDNSIPPGLNDDVLITGPGSVVELDVLNSPRLHSITIENGAKLVVADPAIVHRFDFLCLIGLFSSELFYKLFALPKSLNN